MTIRRAIGRVTVPRQRPAPDQNTIQNPALLRAIQQRLGLRQMTVAPEMSPTLQPVIVVDTIRESSSTQTYPFGAWARATAPTIPNFNGATLLNLVTSRDRRARVQRLTWNCDVAINAVTNIAVGQAPQGVSTGEQVNKGGGYLHIDVNGNAPREIVAAAGRNSACRLITWEGSPLGPATIFEHRILRANAAGPTGNVHIGVWEPPELWLYPGSGVTIWFDAQLAEGITIDFSALWYEEFYTV